MEFFERGYTALVVFIALSVAAPALSVAQHADSPLDHLAAQMIGADRANISPANEPHTTAPQPSARDAQQASSNPNASATTSGQTEEQPVNKSVGPSLEDTGHWIEANLVGLHEEEQHAPHKTTITKASVKGCTLSFTQEDTEGDRTNWTISETMDLGRIEWLKAIPVQKAILGATKGDDVELHYVSMPDQDGKVTPPESRRTSAVGIETDDDAMAARMVKALQHAIDLCKATAKPDLF